MILLPLIFDTKGLGQSILFCRPESLRNLLLFLVQRAASPHSEVAIAIASFPGAGGVATEMSVSRPVT